SDDGAGLLMMTGAYTGWQVLLVGLGLAVGAAVVSRLVRRGGGGPGGPVPGAAGGGSLFWFGGVGAAGGGLAGVVGGAGAGPGAAAHSNGTCTVSVLIARSTFLKTSTSKARPMRLPARSSWIVSATSWYRPASQGRSGVNSQTVSSCAIATLPVSSRPRVSWT